jgi:uncharacterized protein (TIRG00374 family)
VKGHLRSIIGITLSVVLIGWVLRDVKPAVVWAELMRANGWLLAAGTVCATAIFPLRARRWRTILDPVYPKLPFGPLWRSTALGMMVNNTVPARAGEVARAFALTRETRDTTTPVPFSAAIASLAIDRVFDAIVLLMLAFVSVFDPAFPPDVRIAGQSVTHIAIAGGAFVACVLAGLYALVFFPTQLIRIFELFARKLSPTLEAKGRAALETFAKGLSVLRSPGHVAAVFAWTVVHWLVNALGWYISMRGVGIDVPFSATLLLQTLVAMGVAAPAAPGFFGVFEKVAILGLAVYGVSTAMATSWAIGFHILSFIPITVIGAYYFIKLDISFKDISAQQSAA